MAIPNLPDFSEGEVLTAAKMEALVAAIEAKHAGATGTEDMVWPFVARGNINMADYEITDLPRFWSVYNLAERPSTKTVQDVFDDIDADGGGVAYIPADTTISADGVTIHPNTTVLGSGWTSVIAAPATMSDHLFSMNTAGDGDVRFINLHIDGTAHASGNFNGIHFNQVTGARLHDVKFSGFIQAQLNISNDTTAGNFSQGVRVVHCRFEQPGANVPNLLFDDAEDIPIYDCTFEDPTAQAIYGNAANSANVMRDVKILDNKVYADGSCTTGAIEVDGVTAPSATASPTVRRDLTIAGNKVSGADITNTGPAIAVKNFAVFSVDDNEIRDWRADGIVIGANGTHETLGNRLSEPCYTFSCSGNRMHSIGLVGIVICCPTGRFTLNNNNLNNTGEANTGVYFSIEFWNLSATEDFLGSVVVGNIARNNNNVSSPAAGGARTYQGLGQGSTAGGDIGGGASGGNFLMAGNDLENWDGGANDWTPGALRRVVDGGNNF